MISELSPITLGFFGSLAAGLLTGIGALPALMGRVPSERVCDTLLGFAAGVVLAASFFSLIIPSLDVSAELYGEGVIPAGIAVLGILLGMGAIGALNQRMPHEQFRTSDS